MTCNPRSGAFSAFGSSRQGITFCGHLRRGLVVPALTAVFALILFGHGSDCEKPPRAVCPDAVPAPRLDFKATMLPDDIPRGLIQFAQQSECPSQLHSSRFQRDNKLYGRLCGKNKSYYKKNENLGSNNIIMMFSIYVERFTFNLNFELYFVVSGMARVRAAVFHICRFYNKGARRALLS